MTVVLVFSGNNRALICTNCFENDIINIENITEEQKNMCEACFVCEEKFKEPIPYDATKIEQSYTFEIIGDRTKDNKIFCFHMHKDCYSGSASDEWIFEENQEGVKLWT